MLKFENIKIKNKKIWIPLLCLLLLSGVFASSDSKTSDINNADSQMVLDSEGSEFDSEIGQQTDISVGTSDTLPGTEVESSETENQISSGSEGSNNDTSGSQNDSSSSTPPSYDEDKITNVDPTKPSTGPAISIADIPAYSGISYVKINNNIPTFDSSMLSTEYYEYYSELDSLGRCGVTYACVGIETMPTWDREPIGHIRPTGWHTVKYNGIVDGNYLYNRCHLIGFQLTGESANEKNLITGTRQFNVEGMLPFENMVAEYIRATENHVMYRVTPIFDGNNLLASGVQMEAYSVEDNGRGLSFNVFVYNVQDGININYATGESSLAEAPPTSEDGSEQVQGKYAVNSNNGKIHIVGACGATKEGSSQEMSNPVYFDTYEEALAYSQQIAPNLEKRDCGNCW